MARENTPLPRTRIVAPSGEKLASDYETTEAQTRIMSSTGDAADALSESVIERVGDIPLDDDHSAMLAFMAEPISVRIATSTDQNAEQIFEIIVNGRTEIFRRGEVKTVPRYYVDRLARLKETSYSNEEVRNANDERSYAYRPRSALKYDFSIARDDNPLGQSWLNAVLAEQA